MVCLSDHPDHSIINPHNRRLQTRYKLHSYPAAAGASSGHRNYAPLVIGPDRGDNWQYSPGPDGATEVGSLDVLTNIK